MDNIYLVLITLLILIIFLKYTALGQNLIAKAKQEFTKRGLILPFSDQSLGGLYTGSHAISGGIDNAGYY